MIASASRHGRRPFRHTVSRAALGGASFYRAGSHSGSGRANTGAREHATRISNGCTAPSTAPLWVAVAITRRYVTRSIVSPATPRSSHRARFGESSHFLDPASTPHYRVDEQSIGGSPKSLAMSKRLLVCVPVWFLIAFPYSFARSAGLSEGRHPTGMVLGIIGVTALLGVSGFSFVSRGRAPVGGLLGLSVSGLLVFAAGSWSVRISPGEAFLIPMWNAVAGAMTGAFAQRTWTNSGFALVEADLEWIAAALWVPVLRLTEVTNVAYLMSPDAVLGREILTIVPVLLWSRPATRLLFRKATGNLARLVLRSMLCAFVVQELSALSILPLGVVAGGLGGTEGAIVSLARVPGPGIVWGAVMGWMLWMTREREASNVEGGGNSVQIGTAG
jgi:hypothetical protein